jgi:trimethylamine--corrinoid protein Co-methyltransferase
VARGIEVNDETMALDLIHRVNFSGHFLAEPHTVKNFRKEHFIPELFAREPYDAWEKAGSRSALDRARERARKILADHQPRQLDPGIEEELEAFRLMVATRSLEEFYAGELAENQAFDF